MPIPPMMSHPYLGPSFSGEEIKEALEAHGLAYKRVPFSELPSHTAKRIADGQIVAWFQGGMEFGPRALGNRSILGDPRDYNIRTVLNTKIKHREIFRPFCPSCLEEDLHEWFQIPMSTIPDMAKYMLGAFQIQPDKLDLVPAVVHEDGSCRIQAVLKMTNPLYHELLSEFKRLTGVPLFLNTSFNDQEPINCTVEDAIETVGRTKIDCLIMGEYVVEL